MKTIHRAQFEKIGEEGDDKLKDHTVTVLGLGSVGSQVAESLAREDFNLRLVDKGRVEAFDMGRLGIFQEEDITKFKVKQAKRRLEIINPEVKIRSFHEELNDQNIFLIESEMVIDATNQPEINDLVFKHCQEKKIPLLVVRYSGSKLKLLVANKKLSNKDFEWIGDVGNVTEEGVYSGLVIMLNSLVMTRVFKFFLGDTLSYRISGDTWETKLKIEKL